MTEALPVVSVRRNPGEPYSLYKKQSQFYDAIINGSTGLIRDNHFTEFAFFGGFGCGKSLAVMLIVLSLCITYPGTKWLFARQTYIQLRDSVINQFLDKFPPDEFGYYFLKQSKEIHFLNKSVIYFRAFDRDTKILSNEYSGAAVCQAEEVPEELFLQILGRLRHRENGFPKSILILEGNPSSGWCKKRYKDSGLPKNVFFIEATTYENTFLSKDYVERMVADYPESWIRRYVYGEWGNYDEMVFSHFSDIINKIKPYIPPGTHKKFIGGDYGYKNPSAFVWGSVDYDGNIIIFDEFYEREQSIDDLAMAALRHGKLPTVYDYSTKRPDRDGKSVWTELQKKGIPLIESNKDEIRNITVTNGMFKSGRIFITENCVELLREIREYKWKRLKLGSETNLPEAPVDKDNHAIDAMLYLVAFVQDLKSEDPKKIAYKKSIENIIKTRGEIGRINLA